MHNRKIAQANGGEPCRELRKSDANALGTVLVALLDALGISRKRIETLEKLIPQARTAEDKRATLEKVRRITVDGHRPFDLHVRYGKLVLTYDAEPYQGKAPTLAAAVAIAFLLTLGHRVRRGKIPFRPSDGLDTADEAEILRLGRSIRIAGVEPATIH